MADAIMRPAQADLLPEQPQPRQFRQRQLFASHAQIPLGRRQQPRSWPTLPSDLCATRSGGTPMRTRSASSGCQLAARCPAPCDQEEALRTSACTARTVRHAAGRKASSSALAANSRRRISTTRSARPSTIASRMVTTLRRRPVRELALRCAARRGTRLVLPARFDDPALKRMHRRSHHTRGGIATAASLANARSTSRTPFSSVSAGGAGHPAPSATCESSCEHQSAPARPVQLLDLPDGVLGVVLMHVAGLTQGEGGAAPQLWTPQPDAHGDVRAVAQVRCLLMWLSSFWSGAARGAERQDKPVSTSVCPPVSRVWPE